MGFFAVYDSKRENLKRVESNWKQMAWNSRYQASSIFVSNLQDYGKWLLESNHTVYLYSLAFASISIVTLFGILYSQKQQQHLGWKVCPRFRLLKFQPTLAFQILNVVAGVFTFVYKFGLYFIRGVWIARITYLSVVGMLSIAVITPLKSGTKQVQVD